MHGQHFSQSTLSFLKIKSTHCCYGKHSNILVFQVERWMFSTFSQECLTFIVTMISSAKGSVVSLSRFARTRSFFRTSKMKRHASYGESTALKKLPAILGSSDDTF